jgi:ketosteroid isomerase-like protein
MSARNVDTVRELLARFAAGDQDYWRDCFDDEIVWDMSRSNLPAAGVYHGHEGVERFFRDWLGAWDSYEFSTSEFVDAGDSVVVVFHQRARGRTSGVITESDFFGVYDLSDGIVTRYREFLSRDDALEAVGLGD